VRAILLQETEARSSRIEFAKRPVGPGDDVLKLGFLSAHCVANFHMTMRPQGSGVERDFLPSWACAGTGSIASESLSEGTHLTISRVVCWGSTVSAISFSGRIGYVFKEPLDSELMTKFSALPRKFKRQRDLFCVYYINGEV